MVFIQLLGQTHLSMFYLPSVMIFAKSSRLKRLMDDHGLRAGNYRRVLGVPAFYRQSQVLSYHGFMTEVCLCVRACVCVYACVYVNTLVSSRRERGNLTVYRGNSSSW